LIIHLLARRDRQGDRTASASQRVLVVGSGPLAQKAVDMVLDSPELDTCPVGFLDYRREGLWRYRDVPLVGTPDTFERIVADDQIDALVWAVEPSDIPQPRDVLHTAREMGVTVLVMPTLLEPKLARVQPTYFNGIPAMVYRTAPESQLALSAKSVVDIVGALIGTVLFMPIMLAVALWIKLDSKGPVLFKQSRSGLNGKQFMLFKFRTMCNDAETKKEELLSQNEMSGPVFKIKRDPRVTRIGRILRKYSLDELPQFLNVLRGEMSLVGPRPPLPQEVSRFEPWQHRKLSVKPGLTCLWQVNGRNEIDFEEWMQLDLKYIDSWSLLLDAKILMKTLPAVMKGSGR